MTVHAREALSGFEQRWLAEAVRLHEEAQGGGGDDADLPAGDRGGDAEQRILARARIIGARAGIGAEVAGWRGRARGLLGLAAMLAVAGGFGTALAVLGDGDRSVNVLWALVSLLGVNLLMLALWLVSFGVDGRHRGGSLGKLWLWSMRVTAARPAVACVARALALTHARAGIVRWWLGAVAHGLWCGALVGVVAGLVVAFSLRSYGFVWETTILPADFFVRLVGFLGGLPAQFGFSVPEVEAVRASGLGPIADESVRRAWSSWLIGCIVIFGIVPRAALWTLCMAITARGRQAVRLDLGLPYYAALAARLAPASERIGVTDAAPARLERRRAAAAHPLSGRGGALVGLELRTDDTWPPAVASGVHIEESVDDRDQRRAVLARLASNPPARLLVACDARLSPDRGSLQWIAEASGLCGECRIWLFAADRVGDPARAGHWHEGLREIGFPAEAVFDDRFAALRWLERGDE